MRHVPAHLKKDLDALLDLYDILFDGSTYGHSTGLPKAWDVFFDEVGVTVRDRYLTLTIRARTDAKVYRMYK